MANRVYPYIVERRRRARENGLCITCCTKAPKSGRSVCLTCVASAKTRASHRYAKLRERRELRYIVAAHEKAGDGAHEHHLYAEAVQYYRDALKIQSIDPSDEARISEKLAYALSFSDPNAANPLLDRLSASYLNNPAEPVKAVEVLLQRARQLWIDCKAEAALALYEQAVRIADVSGIPDLRKIAYIRMAHCLFGLHRHNETKTLLDSIGGINDTDDVALQAPYYGLKGSLAAVFGNANEAFLYFDRAVRITEQDTDVFRVVSIWRTYAFYADALGNIEIAKSHHERALLVARQFHITWLIQWACLGYANLLSRTGKYARAYDYLLDALSYDSHVPVMDGMFAECGIPIALHFKDDVRLAKCTRASAIEFAFRSKDPDQIGPIAAAFAQWHVAQGRKNEAQALLHRATIALDKVVQIWDFPITLARFGALPDAPRARSFIEQRASLPCAAVALACLDLFDAFVAQRQGRRNEMRRYAMDAIEKFNALGWHGYVDLANTLLPSAMKTLPMHTHESRPFADISSPLTAREREVAEFVLQGRTNREISELLSIKERTVEAHLTSIMSRLGIRSRHQLPDQL